MDSIAFIESNTTGTGEIFLITAQNLGLRIVFLTATPEKYLFLKKLLLHPVIIDTSDINLVYEYLHKVKNLVGVISTSESFVYNAAAVAQKFGLPHVTPIAIANCRDKFKFAELLKEAKLPAIATTKSINANFDFPVVVKPNPGTGSIGVKLCSSSDELNKHIIKLNNTNILIQEYIEGPEYSAEIIVVDGEYHFLGITEKHLGPEPYFVEHGHDFPANISDKLYKDIIEVLKKALQKVEFNFGPVHIEFRVKNEKIYIIEINPRLAGGMIPILIEQSQGVNLIKNLVKLFIGKKADFQSNFNLATKIAFIIPKKEGIFKKIQGIQAARKEDNIVAVSLYKNIGDQLTLKGDFSDRIGFIIAKAESAPDCQEAINNSMSNITISIEGNLPHCGRARLAEPLDPRVKQILEDNIFSDFDDLELLSKINNAHIKMLEKCQIISNSQAVDLLAAIDELEAESFASVHAINDCGIGFYLAYEQCLIDKLGVKAAGVIHTGRSRNDINATIQRLKSREVYKELYKSLCGLRSDLLQVASKSLDIAMPIYSQYQAAMPATYAYYLIAVENALAITQTNLRQMADQVNTTTLGSSSGAGTTYPIDPSITAKLLGFSIDMPNALTVVATRDLELMLLSIGSTLGVTISRIAQDYHLWLTHEFSFFELPDRLCGISSAMPQKKNPYLLEKIKGKAIGISGKLGSAMATMQKVPFANSVEVGTEALTGYTESFSELIKAIKLLSMIVQGAKPIEKNMDRSNKDGLTVATEVAESLAKAKRISCREAHNIVGKAINQALNENSDPLTSILSLVQDLNSNPRTWHKNLEYGNGSGVKSTIKMLEKAINTLNDDQIFFNQKLQSSLQKSTIR